MNNAFILWLDMGALEKPKLKRTFIRTGGSGEIFAKHIERLLANPPKLKKGFSAQRELRKLRGGTLR